MTSMAMASGGTRVVIDLDPGAVARMMLPSGQVGRWTRGQAGRVATAARQNAPVKTGRLRASVTVGQARDVRGRFISGYEVSANVPYAWFVEKGTRPHVIRPRSASILRFQVGGQTVFARVVHHPGTRATSFMADALRVVQA